MSERISGATSADRGDEESDLTSSRARRFPETAGFRESVVGYTLPKEVETKLDKHQKRALDYLTAAARGLAAIYDEQRRPSSADPQEPFYPKDATKDEIREAGRQNPDILSPYTIVTRGDSGELNAIPQFIYYRNLIKQEEIVQFLQRAAKEIRKSKRKDPLFESFLRERAMAFQTGDFEKSEVTWLTREDEPEINIEIGFDDTYADRFLGIKYAAEAWVDVYDPETTFHVREFQNRFLSVEEERSDRPRPLIRSRVAYLKIATGQAGVYEWTGQSMPCQPEWRQKYGSLITIWKEPLEDKFRTKLAAFGRFINHINRRGVQHSSLRLANLRTHAGHEMAHTWVNGNIDALGDHKNTVKELYCDLVALDNYRQIKDFNPRESEIAMALKLSSSYIEYMQRETRKEYSESSTILLNYLIEKGSIWIENGLITWSDTPQVFEDIGELRGEMEDIIEKGSVGRVREIKRSYLNLDVYDYLITRQSYPFPAKEIEDPGTALQSQL